MRGNRLRTAARWRTAVPLGALGLVIAVSGPAAAGDGSAAGIAEPVPRCLGEDATILGTPGNDRGKKKVVGTADRDVIVTFGGRDRIKAKGGPDLICSGRGADLVLGNAGRDEVDGGPGDDKIKGNRGDDDLSGGADDDRLYGGANDDRCHGGRGKDRKRGCERAGKGKGSKPKARKDRASTDEASATTIDVLANDDPKKLKIVAVDDSGAAGAAAIKGDRVEYDPDGRFEALAAGQSETDSFKYTVKNRKGKRDSATVKVTIDGLDDPSTVTTSPTLYPTFSSEIRDYVVRCTGGPVSLDVATGPGNRINVDGQGARGGSFTTQVALQENQRFRFVRSTGAGQSTHHVRCLPADFPEWSFERFATPQQQWYVVAVPDYVFAVDGHGVPVWWFKDLGLPTDAKFLADGTFAWGTDRDTEQARYEIRALNGTKIRDVKTAGTMTDGHDLQLLPNGNYLMMAYKERATTEDLSSYPGGSATAKVVDAELQEIDPDDPNNPVWEWNSKDHIDVAEIGHWWEDWVRDRLIDGAHDIVHINSAEMNGDSVLISMRHTDGVYEIDKSTGDINWKLGGTTTPQSLDVDSDPLGAHPLGGQHDARLLPDGSITIFDNGAFVSDTDPVHRAPRAVRYQINEGAKTATLLESVSDSDVTGALCCGSARRSPSGSWLVGWGGLFNPISEFNAAGTRTFKLDFPGTWSYRGHPVAFGELSRAALRGGMDSQWPR